MSKKLTEQQQAFLDALFSEEAKGNVRTAMRIAGYSPSTSSKHVTDPLAEEIAELTAKFIASSTTSAAYALFDILNNPTELGNKDKMLAAKDLLDRAGFVKTEKVEVKTKDPVFILPPKRSDDD